MDLMDSVLALPSHINFQSSHIAIALDRTAGGVVALSFLITTLRAFYPLFVGLPSRWCRKVNFFYGHNYPIELVGVLDIFMGENALMPLYRAEISCILSV